MHKKILSSFIILGIAVIVFQAVFVIVRSAATDSHANWRIVARAWHRLSTTRIARGDTEVQGTVVHEVADTAEDPQRSIAPIISIVDYLASIGTDTSFSHRAQLAAEHGITGYRGTQEQNTTLLYSLRSTSGADGSRAGLGSVPR